MKVLILGSDGFIGSHALQYFRSKGDQVTAADIVLKTEPDYLLINPEMPNFSSIFMNRAFDACINATGAANVQFSFEQPSMDYILNVANVFAMLDAIRLYNPSCKFINLSSAAVYGNPASLPVKENAALAPLSPYGYHKMYSEKICNEFYELYNIPTISVRIFSAFGEGLKKQLFWDLYTKISKADRSIELFGTGKESRDFIYIADIMQALDCILGKASFQGEAINVASGHESTIEKVVDIFMRQTGKKLDVQFTRNNKMGDPLNWKADISLLQQMGFQNKYSLEEGINKYCAWVTGRK